MLPIKHFDRIDLLVNSAGINIAKPFTEYTPGGLRVDDWHERCGLLFHHAKSGHTNAQTEVGSYCGHLDGFGGSAFSRRDDYVASGYKVNNASVSPRIGDGIPG